jgi:cobalt-zinc-cadmium efflux system outer membrane protein
MMPLLRQAGGCAKVGLLCTALVTGCASTGKEAKLTARPLTPMAHSPVDIARVRADLPDPHVRNAPHAARTHPADSLRVEPADIVTVDHTEMSDGPPSGATDGQELFAGDIELALPELLIEVERRNPSLQAALAAWGAAGERAPQVLALDDPTLTTMFAPASFSSSTIQSSYIVGVGQKIPWAGKRELRGHVALWNAVAASLDYDEVRLRLAEAARLAYYDYYNVFRQLEVNDAGLAAVRAFRETAKSKFEASQVTEQDLLQADVELAQLEQRRIILEQARQVATARINLLLHREPQLALPLPPQRIEVAGDLPDVDALRAQALESRPDLSAIMARVQAGQNEVALMCKEFYPDFEVMGRYDTFWTDPAQRAQVALNLNMPLNQDRRQAALREAIFRLNKLQAEYNQQVDTVRSEVQTAFARLAASRRTLELFTAKLLPASESNVSAATSGYEAGTIDFLRLVQAQRELIDLNEKYQMAIVEYYRNRAELDRVVGTGLSPR